MKSLSFNEGYKELMINDDPNRVIRYNPTDMGILERIQSAINVIDKAQSSIVEGQEDESDSKVDAVIDKVATLSSVINEQIDYIFASEVSSVVFGNQSPISLVNGKYLYENFLEAITVYMTDEISAEFEMSNARISKYVEAVQ